MSEQAAIVAEPSITVDDKGKTVGEPAKQVTEPAKKDPPAEEKPHWLDARLERERKGVLKELGIEDLDSAKKALADYKAKVEAEKTAEQKAAELQSKAAALEAKLAKQAEALKATAEERMAGLTAEQKAAVEAVAGDDPAKQLKTIAALSPTWAKTSEATKQVADTAPARNAPDAKTSSAPEPKAVWEELKKTNPILAARYALANKIFDE